MRQALRPPALLGLLNNLSTDAHTRDPTHDPKHKTKSTTAFLNHRKSRSGLGTFWIAHNSTITHKSVTRLTTSYTGHKRSTMNASVTEFKAYRGDTNNPIRINKLATSNTTKIGLMKSILSHKITNNSLIQKIRYQKQLTKPSARLRRNSPTHGFNKKYDQRSLTAPTKLTFCRQTKRQNP